MCGVQTSAPLAAQAQGPQVAALHWGRKAGSAGQGRAGHGGGHCVASGVHTNAHLGAPNAMNLGEVLLVEV